jgi:4'-phosphopantetheinyl transferase
VTRIGECGIDIEAVGELPDHLPIHPQFFSLQQNNWINKGNGDAGPGRRFLRLWTRKEAYLKATGEGLVGLSSQIGFETAERGPARVIDERLSEGLVNKFFVYDLANNFDYCLSVCLDRKPSHIELCSLTFGRMKN